MGPLGVWSAALSRVSVRDARSIVRGLEAAGASTLWISEGATSRELLSHAAVLLAATRSLVIASGIANIHARDAQAMANGARTLADAYPGRFLLGIGVSHRPRVEDRGGTWRSPMSTMVDYLDAMSEASSAAPQPTIPPPVVLGALGPRMTRLAGERTDGIHPYLVPVEHIADARSALGPHPVIASELMVVLANDSDEARSTARAELAPYLRLENYRRNLLRLGFTPGELDDGGSDRLVDAIVAWGGASAIRRRITEFRAAGADHVCIQFLGEPPELIPDRFAALVADRPSHD